MPGQTSTRNPRTRREPVLRWWRPLLLAAALVIGAGPSAATAARADAGPAAQLVRAAATAAPVDGTVAGLGTAALGGLAGVHLSRPLVGMAATPDRGGYWLAATDGGVFSFGDAAFHGSTGNLTLNQPVVGMAGDPRTGGYWLVAADGGVFAFDAPFYGSLGGLRLQAPIVGMVATADGGGYWMVAADGGVFAFGDAAFHGSTGNLHLNQPVVGMAADPATGGYWLAATDGGVFAFDAPFVGSLGGISLQARVVGIASTPDGGGFWLLGADGGIFTFGRAVFHGTEPTSTAAPAIGLAAGTTGYWVVYGAPSAPSQILGPPPNLPAAPGGGPSTLAPTDAGVLSGKVVAIDPGHNGGNGADPAFINAPIFNGVGEESCDTTGTETDSGYTEAQFNFDVAEYLAAELRAVGATVVLTRTTNAGVGPCVNERAAIGNDARVDAAVSIHADGGPPGGRGFAILEPVADGINNAIVAPSAVLGTDLRNAFGAGTGEPVSNYDGIDGIQPRNDLGGINLSTVPKVFIECANLRDATDAGLAASESWQSLAANGIAQGLTTFLTS